MILILIAAVLRQCQIFQYVHRTASLRFSDKIQGRRKNPNVKRTLNRYELLERLSQIFWKLLAIGTFRERFIIKKRRRIFFVTQVGFIRWPHYTSRERLSYKHNIYTCIVASRHAHYSMQYASVSFFEEIARASRIFHDFLRLLGFSLRFCWEMHGFETRKHINIAFLRLQSSGFCTF